MPNNTVAVDADTAQKVLRLIDNLEDNDDVQTVSHNAEFPESVNA
jgi:transcriptional/translational regulatory protein YebC/TACO1